MRGRVLPPRTKLLRRIVLDRSGVDLLPQVEIKELGVGEDGQIILEIIGPVMLIDHVVGGWDGVEVGDVLRHIRAPPTVLEASHGLVSVTGMRQARRPEKNGRRSRLDWVDWVD